MKITVLYGGPSSEREISLISGAAVADGLKTAGHDVTLCDILPTNLSALDIPADVIFPVLHGAWGESGELQEILEKRNLPFVGSGSRASRQGMDKVVAKQVWQSNGLPTPRWQVVSDLASISSAIDKVQLPCVVKVIDGGSSIDVYLCKTSADAHDACQKMIAKYGKALIEQFIRGTELTIGILEESPLQPIRITTTREFYDFTSKYKGNFTEYHFDLNLPDPVVQQVRQLARKAHAALGCRHLSRVDIMLDEAHQPYLLEINTLPGFTAKSLLPKAAKHAGTEFAPLVDRLVRRAHADYHASMKA